MNAKKEREIQHSPSAEAMSEQRPLYSPATDIYETKDAIYLVADMPGVAADDVEITLENRILEVRGKVAPQRPEGLELVYSEYRVGDFQRSFRLSEEIDREHIKARLMDGVLEIELPKAAETKARRIEVKSA